MLKRYRFNKKLELLSSRLAVAPMMGYTDIHFLKLINLYMPEVDLYTEMQVAQAFIRSHDINYKKKYGISGRLILQLGGSDSYLLAECAAKAKSLGYDAINLNVGCPSSRVVKGKIGAVLMRSPDLVAECVAEMSRHHQVSVKTRIGVDHYPDNLSLFTKLVVAAGARELIVHARRAWLKGLDPKQNRSVPPLDYLRVCKLKQEFPDVFISLNGGINSLALIDEYDGFVDGFMLGRYFYSNPLQVSVFADALGLRVNGLAGVFADYWSYAEASGSKSNRTLRHLMSFLKGFPGAASVRAELQKLMLSNNYGSNILKDGVIAAAIDLRQG